MSRLVPRATLDTRLSALYVALSPLAARIRAQFKVDATKWWRVRNAEDDELAKLYIYAPITDWDGITADQFVRDLDKITAPTIELHINSPGGLVFDGMAIYAALRDHPSTVNVVIDGVAASAASFVAMAGDTVAIQKPAKMFIHDAMGLVFGPAADMRKTADVLDELSDTLAGIYADRSGGSVADFREAMLAETWYSAQAALDAGLVDRIIGEADPAAPDEGDGEPDPDAPDEPDPDDPDESDEPDEPDAPDGETNRARPGRRAGAPNWRARQATQLIRARARVTLGGVSK